MSRHPAYLIGTILTLGICFNPSQVAAQSGNIALRVCRVLHTPPPVLGCNYDISQDFPVETSVLSTPSGPFFYVFLVGLGFGDDPNIGGDGISTIAGLECGIDYPGAFLPEGGAGPICVFDWVNLGDLQFPSSGWPAPGGGNLITWANCGGVEVRRNGISYAVAGYFYLGAYAPAQIRVTPRPVSGSAKLARCHGSEVDLTPPHNNCALGMAGFQMSGFNGICAVPVQEMTWSGIKSLYR